jgi:hypothetical protein
MDGALDSIIDALITHYQAEKLKEEANRGLALRIHLDNLGFSPTLRQPLKTLTSFQIDCIFVAFIDEGDPQGFLKNSSSLIP